MEQKKPPVWLTGFRDGQAVLSDSTTVAIPHLGDTAWTVFLCVRHAEKVKNAGDNPPLLPEGEARAERLGNLLKGIGIDRVSTTNYKRTIQTGEIVRRVAGSMPAETYPPANQDMWLEQTLAGSAGQHILVVGHQNTIPRLLNRLKGDSLYANIPDDDHGRLYIAVTRGIGQTEVVELHYE